MRRRPRRRLMRRRPSRRRAPQRRSRRRAFRHRGRQSSRRTAAPRLATGRPATTGVTVAPSSKMPTAARARGARATTRVRTGIARTRTRAPPTHTVTVALTTSRSGAVATMTPTSRRKRCAACVMARATMAATRARTTATVQRRASATRAMAGTTRAPSLRPRMDVRVLAALAMTTVSSKMMIARVRTVAPSTCTTTRVADMRITPSGAAITMIATSLRIRCAAGAVEVPRHEVLRSCRPQQHPLLLRRPHLPDVWQHATEARAIPGSNLGLTIRAISWSRGTVATAADALVTRPTMMLSTWETARTRTTE